jgi:5-methylcytosine-specific restriction endonuclease McrA
MSGSLRSLSDSDILSRVRDLTARERKLTLSLILHLNEIERRSLHLKEGYSSMFDYCTTGLGYSEPAAIRRIVTARCVARFPEVYGLLETNELNLSSVARVSRVLTAANKDVLLARIRRRSHREVEAVVAEYQPRAKLRDVVRPVVVRVPDALAPLLGSNAHHDPGADAVAIGSSATVSNTNAGVVGVNASADAVAGAAVADADPVAVSNTSACEKAAYLRCEGDFDPTQSTGESSRAFVTEKCIQFQFTASEAFQTKFEKIKTLAWHRLPSNPSLEQVFELALDFFIARQDPRSRRERREQRRKRALAKVRSSDTETPKAVARSPQAPCQSRYIGAIVKDEVFGRDDGQCSYLSANGRRCTSRTALQIDHIKPVARGGASTLDNLRLLCAYHNRLESERLMGPLARRDKQGHRV